MIADRDCTSTKLSRPECSRRSHSEAAAAVMTLGSSAVAFAAAVAVISGGTYVGEEIERRMPWESPVVLGVFLAIIVGLPMARATYDLLFRTDQAAGTTLIAGALLLGWVAIQMTHIHAVHPLLVVPAAVGVTLVVAGLYFAHQVSNDKEPAVGDP